MLTKNDLKAIGQLIRTAIREEAVTKEEIKSFATKDDLRKELQPIKQDMAKLKEISNFTKQAVINLLNWSQDIHNSIIKEKLPERVKKLEHLFKSS